MKMISIKSESFEVIRAVEIISGLSESETNAVIFRDTPEVWFQFFLGLYLEKHTFVLVRKIDLTEPIYQQLHRGDVVICPVEEFDEAAMKNFTIMIERWINRPRAKDAI